MGKGYLVIGAGFAGAVIARELAERLGEPVLMIDRRDHVAGNSHTSRDEASGIMIHRYGPHIFNTNNVDVWNYIQRFGEIVPYANHVKAVTPRGMFSLPINLLTINQFFHKNLSPTEAKQFLAEQADQSIGSPANFEEQALKMVGRELYENFFRGYTIKQWGCAPSELPASILKRLPIRFNYNDVFYDKKYQGIPREGYTEIMKKILDHPLIEVRLDTPFSPSLAENYRHVFYTGSIDEFFGYQEGRLAYRTVTFERIDAEGDFQGNAVINYTSEEIPWTRIHEHKHFTPWEEHPRTVAFREYSRETSPSDDPYYPKRLTQDVKLLAIYREMASQTKDITFLGRLATYRYMDMETVIAESLSYARHYLHQPSETWPKFPNQE